MTRALRQGEWSLGWKRCQECGTTARPHKSKGLCTNCYAREIRKGKNHCIDCGAEISPQSTYCNFCKGKIRGGHWARDWDCCRECGTTNRPHKAKGLCMNCYARELRKGGNHCIDCDVTISPQATRCRPCNIKNYWEGGVFGNEEWLRTHSEHMKAQWKQGDFDHLSESMKERWADGEFDDVFDEEWRQRHSQAIAVAWKRGAYEGVFGEEWRWNISERMKQHWERGTYDGVFQSPTSIELQVGAALDIIGIEHKSQYRPDGYSCIYDEFVPPNTFIEVQGDYWHSLPKRQQRDAEKRQWAKEHGFELIEIWEHEIKERGAWAIVAQIFADRLLP